MKLCYDYLIQEERTDLLHDIIVVVNDTIENESITEQVDIFLYYKIPGGMGRSIRLCNYSDDEMTTVDCDGLQRIVIGGNSEEIDSFLNNPSAYTSIPNIKYLEIRKSIQERAEEEGINWYEYWPELESVEVFE